MEYEQILKEIRDLLWLLQEHNAELAYEINQKLNEHSNPTGECGCQ